MSTRKGCQKYGPKGKFGCANSTGEGDGLEGSQSVARGASKTAAAAKTLIKQKKKQQQHTAQQ